MSSTVVLLGSLVLLGLCVAGYVVWPLLRGPAAPGRDAPGVERSSAAVGLQVLRERRRELEAALAHLPADAPERRDAMAELAAQAAIELPADGDRAAAAGGAATGSKWGFAVLLAAVVVVPAFALYLMSGAPESVLPGASDARQPASLESAAAGLRERLQREPDRVEGWQLLGRTELALGRFAEAAEALERAAALAPGDAQVKADLADAIAQSRGGDLEGRPIELIRQALAIDPSNRKGLALSGAWEYSRRNFPAAIAQWEKLLALLPPDSPEAGQIGGFVANLKAGRAPGAPAAGANPPAPSASPTPPAPSAGAAAPAAGPSVSGSVLAAPALADRIRPTDTVFIAARTLDDAGKPTGPPVAVLRARAAELPLAFRLDDSMAMSPAAKLSGASRVAIVARISRSGQASAQPGDLQGASSAVAPGATGVRVLIDRVVD